MAYDKLKEALCNATESRLAIIDTNKPFHLLVDSNDHTVSGVLTQVDDAGIEQPIALSSQKLSKTQKIGPLRKRRHMQLSALCVDITSGFFVLRSLCFRTTIYVLILLSLQ